MLTDPEPKSGGAVDAAPGVRTYAAAMYRDNEETFLNCAV